MVRNGDGIHAGSGVKLRRRGEIIIILVHGLVHIVEYGDHGFHIAVIAEIVFRDLVGSGGNAGQIPAVTGGADDGFRLGQVVGTVVHERSGIILPLKLDVEGIGAVRLAVGHQLCQVLTLQTAEILHQCQRVIVGGVADQINFLQTAVCAVIESVLLVFLAGFPDRDRDIVIGILGYLHGPGGCDRLVAGGGLGFLQNVSALRKIVEVGRTVDVGSLGYGLSGVRCGR